MSEVLNEADEERVVRVSVEVAGLTEVWELPLRGSALASALAAIEAVAAELHTRYQQAQELERQFGGEADGSQG